MLHSIRAQRGRARSALFSRVYVKNSEGSESVFTTIWNERRLLSIVTHIKSFAWVQKFLISGIIDQNEIPHNCFNKFQLSIIWLKVVIRPIHSYKVRGDYD